MKNSEIIGADKTARPAPKKSKKLIPYCNNLCSRYAEKMLSIKITSQCNRSCNFCVDRGGYKNTKVDVDSVVKNAKKYGNYQTVIITGGEPLVVFDEVCELIAAIRPHKKRIVLNTNGVLLSEQKILTLNDLIDELQLSVHHFDEVQNGRVFNGVPVKFEFVKDIMKKKKFMLSINSCLGNWYTTNEMKVAVKRLISLCNYFGAERLRLTELKKVGEEMFIQASHFFEKDSPVLGYNSFDLITKGCTYYYRENGIDVSVKRLCDFAKGKNAIAFSCCFIDSKGQKKINVDTKNTFKVLYGDGTVTDDWIFSTEKSPVLGEEFAQENKEVVHTSPNMGNTPC